MIHKILISDRSFNALEEVQDKASNVKWEYGRIGGCGSFSFDLPIKYCRQIQIGLNFNVKIYRRNPSTKAYDLWYQGRIENTTHNIRGEDEVLNVQGMGYQSALKDIYVDRDYTSTESSAIVTNILNNDVTPNTDITYVGGDITATTFTPNNLKFNTDALNSFQQISEIVGSREWGVDANRKFFFKQRSSTVGHIYYLGDKITNFSLDITSNDIVNRIIVIGAETGGTPFTATYDSVGSQLKWKRRDRVIKNSSITTSAVASQLATAQFAELNDVVRRARLDLLKDVQIESTVPIPLFRVIPQQITYNQYKYGTFLYSGNIDMQVNRIVYTIDNTGNLFVSLQLGQLRPDITENITNLEYEISQLQAEAV